ncbi:Npat protein, partial [Triplophysa rosa]
MPAPLDPAGTTPDLASVTAAPAATPPKQSSVSVASIPELSPVSAAAPPVLLSVSAAVPADPPSVSTAASPVSVSVSTEVPLDPPSVSAAASPVPISVSVSPVPATYRYQPSMYRYLQQEGLTATSRAFIFESPNLKEYAEHSSEDGIIPACVFV